jgi:hypothetical protein
MSIEKLFAGTGTSFLSFVDHVLENGREGEKRRRRKDYMEHVIRSACHISNIIFYKNY